MKRKISFILILLLICILSLAGCGGSSGDDSSNSDSTSTETNLADNINEIFQSGTYQMDISMSMSYEGEQSDVDMVIAVDGNNMAGQTSIQGMNMSFVMKDGQYYLINHDQKIIFVSEYDSSEEIDTIEIPSLDELSDDDMTFAKKSDVEIDGETLICEEYTVSADETVKYYFKNNTLVRMDVISGSYTQTMKINEIKGTVDSELFEIPSTYQQMSM
jgi:hypothetical protein